jgi:hypothetical protein
MPSLFEHCRVAFEVYVVNLTKKLMERVFPRNQLHPLHIGRGLVRVDAFFSSFFRAERKDKMGCGGIPHSTKWKTFNVPLKIIHDIHAIPAGAHSNIAAFSKQFI